jgi:hypothetical protein
MSYVVVLVIVEGPGVASHKCILGPQIDVVVDLPIDLADFSRRMKHALSTIKLAD